MENEKLYTEKNIEKLIGSSLKTDSQLTEQQKEAVLNMLLQKVPQPPNVTMPKSVNLIGLSVIWLIILVLFFSEIEGSTYILNFIKAALGLSLLFIPVSSIVLIVLIKSHEKKLV